MESVSISQPECRRENIERGKKKKEEKKTKVKKKGGKIKKKKKRRKKEKRTKKKKEKKRKKDFAVSKILEICSASYISYKFNCHKY